MNKKNIKIIIFSFITIFLVIGIIYGALYLYNSSRFHALEPSNWYVLVSEDKIENKEIIAEEWMITYLNQYTKNYAPKNCQVRDFGITETKELDEDNVMVKFWIKTTSTNSNILVEKLQAGIDEEGNIEGELVLSFEIFYNYDVESNVAFVSRMRRPSAYDLEKYNTSGQVEKDYEYYQAMNKKKYEDMNRDCTYKIENGKIYLTYDHSNTWTEVPQEISKDIIEPDDYILGAKYYGISKEITYLADENSIYVSNNQGKDFKKVEYIMSYDIEFVYAEDINTIHIACAADYAMGRFAILSYNTSDCGKSWQEYSTYEQVGWLSYASKFCYIDNKAIFIIAPNIEESDAKLYLSIDGMKNFSEVILPESTLTDISENINLTWNQVYDTVEEVKRDGNKYQVIVGQGSDGDYKGNKYKALYESEDGGKTWTFIKEYEPEPEAWEG